MRRGGPDDGRVGGKGDDFVMGPGQPDLVVNDDGRTGPFRVGEKSLGPAMRAVVNRLAISIRVGAPVVQVQSQGGVATNHICLGIY